MQEVEEGFGLVWFPTRSFVPNPIISASFFLSSNLNHATPPPLSSTSALPQAPESLPQNPNLSLLQRLIRISWQGHHYHTDA